MYRVQWCGLSYWLCPGWSSLLLLCPLSHKTRIQHVHLLFPLQMSQLTVNSLIPSNTYGWLLLSKNNKDLLNYLCLFVDICGYRIRPKEMWKTICTSAINIFTEYCIMMLSLKKRTEDDQWRVHVSSLHTESTAWKTFMFSKQGICEVNLRESMRC